MKSPTVELNRKATDAILSARCILRLAAALKSVNKQSVTPDELNQMAKMLAKRAEEFRSVVQDGNA